MNTSLEKTPHLLVKDYKEIDSETGQVLQTLITIIILSVQKENTGKLYNYLIVDTETRISIFFFFCFFRNQAPQLESLIEG